MARLPESTLVFPGDLRHCIHPSLDVLSPPPSADLMSHSDVFRSPLESRKLTWGAWVVKV